MLYLSLRQIEYVVAVANAGSLTLAAQRVNISTPCVAHRAASLEVLRSLAANGEGIGMSNPNSADTLSYDGKPLERAAIVDPNALEPIVLVRGRDQPAPVPEICAAMVSTADADQTQSAQYSE